ncbi:MAG: T9SS type A sorting domain-containing protein [Lutibacter sp.]
MQKNYPQFNFFHLLIFLFFTISSFSYNAGDFRSNGTGDWTTLTSWQYYNGSGWVTPTTAQGYPGQISTPSKPQTGAVLIQQGHMITIGTADLETTEIGTLTINGTLKLNGANSSASNFTINTQTLIITHGLTPLATISFINKVNLILPANVSIQVETNGFSGDCNNNIQILIGKVIYAYCTGGGGMPTFEDIINNHGYNHLITATASPTSICNSGTSIITATTSPSSLATYKWYYAESGGTSFVTGNSITVSPTTTTTYYVEASYTSTLPIYTTVRKAVTVTVNPSPSTPTITAGGTTTFCTGGSVTLTSSAGTKYLWSTGATTQSISPTISGSYTVKITNANGCQSTSSAATAVTVNATNNWKGLSAVWNDTNNWSCGVPTETSDITNVIPTGVPFYPNLDSDISLKNLTVNDGAHLKVINNGLTITGKLTLNGKIDLNNESQLLQGLGSTFVGTGTIEIDQQGTGNSYWYNYWSSPVNTGGAKYTIGGVLKDGTDPTNPNKNGGIDFGAPYPFADGVQTSPIKLSTYWMYVLRNSNAGYSAWFRVGDTGEIAAGEGYSMKGSNTSAAEQNYTFVGKPNNGNINLPINTGSDYLVGNPYPSALDADKFISENTNTTGTIYFWEHYGGDTHILAGYQAGYATFSLGGGVMAATPALGVSTKGHATKVPGPYIPVGQAFFVSAISTGDIKFNNGQRKFIKESLGNSIFMKSNNTQSKTANNLGDDLRPKFRIGFDAPKISHRQLLMTIDERATKGVDWGFDAEIYEVFEDDMYWMLDHKKYVIQGTNKVDSDSEVPLGIQLSKTGTVTVKIDALENVDKNTHVYLKDKLTGETFSMMGEPVQLNLAAGKYTDRFVITFKTILIADENAVLMDEDVLTTVKNSLITEETSVAQNEQILKLGLHIFMNNPISELQINNATNTEIRSINLFNNVGQMVNSWNSNLNKRDISLPVHKATGIYHVQIITKSGTTLKKVIIE